jgi:hypothetical protein
LHTLKGNILPGHQNFAVQHEFSRTRGPLYLILQSNYHPRAPHVILIFSPSFPPTPAPSSSTSSSLLYAPPLPSLDRRAAPSLRRCASLRRAPACHVLAPPAQTRAKAARARPWRFPLSLQATRGCAAEEAWRAMAEAALRIWPAPCSR